MPTAPKAPPAKVALTPLPSLEDSDLVRRARDGDERAFEEIVRRYQAPLIRYSARHVGRDHAEDVTQHALAKAAAHLRDDPRPIHLRAWLYRVAHNAALNLRARKDFGHEELSLEIDGVPQPPELAAQRAEVREVVSHVDDLPERQRTALLLSVFEGLGYDEIASRLDTSPNSVRALLSRARGHLRKAGAALAPLPLIESLARKIGAAIGASSGGQGTLAAGGSVVQAKLVAVAATTAVVGGAATAERAASRDHGDPGANGGAMVAASDAPAAVPLELDGLLANAASTGAPDRPAEKAKAEPTPEEPPPAPEPPVQPVAPVEPAPAPPPPAPVVEEAPPPSEPAPAPEPEAPKEEAHYESDPPPADGTDPPISGGDPVGYTPAPSGGYRQP